MKAARRPGTGASWSGGPASLPWLPLGLSEVAGICLGVEVGGGGEEGGSQRGQE